MGKTKPSGSLEPQIPAGYGKLVSVIPFGPKEVVLWLEDSGGGIRALRMKCDTGSNGLALEITGEARIART